MPTIEEMMKQLADMQRMQAELMEAIKKEQENQEKNSALKLMVQTFFGNTNAVVAFKSDPEEIKRDDVKELFLNFHSYRRNWNGHVVNVTEWEALRDAFLKLPNASVTYDDKNAEKLIHDYLHAPGYSVEFKQNYFKITVSQRAKVYGNIFYAIASAKYNHNHDHWEVAHSDSIALWHTLEKYNDQVVWDKDSLEFITKTLSQKSRADEVALKKVSDTYKPIAKFPTSEYTLKDYQTVSQEFADVVDDRMLLADGMGLGKSPQAIFRAINKNWCTIFIPPAGLVENWRLQILKFTGIEPMIIRGLRSPDPLEIMGVLTRQHKLIILPMSTFGYKQNVRNDAGEDVTVYPWADFVNMTLPDLVVFDEGHYVSNPDAARGAAAQRINVKRVWMMTGTPLKNRVKDMIVLAKIVRPDLFPSIERAVEAYTVDGRGVRNLDKLQDMFKQFMLRRTQKDVYSPEELKQKTYIQKPYTLSESDKKEYNDILAGLQREFNAMTGEFDEKAIPNILVQFMRLKQLCSLAKVSDIVELAESIADSQDNPEYIIGQNFPKIMILTQFVETAKAIKVELGSRAILVTGESHSPSARVYEVQRFHKDPNIPFYIGTIQAHQEGLDITGAGYHIYVDYMWTAMAHDQAEGRSYMRSNDPHGLEIFETLIPNSIEDHVRAIIEEKRQLSEACVDGAEAARLRGSSIVKDVIERMKKQAYLK